MTLLEFLDVSQNDYDTCDDVYDITVTTCWIEEDPDDYYNKFCRLLYSKIHILKNNGKALICDWNQFIENNYKVFRKFSEDYWVYMYPDKEDFIYEWIKEIHLYLAGYVSDGFYEDLYNFISKLD